MPDDMLKLKFDPNVRVFSFNYIYRSLNLMVDPLTDIFVTSRYAVTTDFAYSSLYGSMKPELWELEQN